MNTEVKKAVKTALGVVVSNKCDQTITVLVERQIKHPLYKKFIKRTKKFMAHDAENACNVGDYVKITESRPYSKRKTWRLDSIIEKATG